MNYTGNENHSIGLDDAAAMTERYRDNRSTDQTIIAEYFGKDAITEIFAQQDCVGMRIYYALDEQMIQKLVIVGVDGNGDDLYNGKLAEFGLTCPANCAASNPLNS